MKPALVQYSVGDFLSSGPHPISEVRKFYRLSLRLRPVKSSSAPERIGLLDSTEDVSSFGTATQHPYYTRDFCENSIGELKREGPILFHRKRIHNRRPSRINSRMKAASSIARSTKNPFAIFGLFGSRSMSLRAARIVAANRMANFLSSVISSARI